MEERTAVDEVREGSCGLSDYEEVELGLFLLMGIRFVTISIPALDVEKSALRRHILKHICLSFMLQCPEV